MPGAGAALYFFNAVKVALSLGVKWQGHSMRDSDRRSTIPLHHCHIAFNKNIVAVLCSLWGPLHLCHMAHSSKRQRQSMHDSNRRSIVPLHHCQR